MSSSSRPFSRKAGLMFHCFRPVLQIFAGAAFLAGTALTTAADDYLSRAAELYRDKDFGAAYSTAGKSSEQTYRSFVRGMAALRTDKFEEAATLLAEAEQKLPLIADYAAYYQAEALFKLKRFPAASAKAASIHVSSASPRVVRRTEKLNADILFETRDYKGALKAYQAYIEKYPSGGDAVDAGFQAARCREETADAGGALTVYRSIWLNNPASPQAVKA